MVPTIINECKILIPYIYLLFTYKHQYLFLINISLFYFFHFQLFKPKEDKDDSTKIIYQPPKSLLVACQQIVDCLIEHLLQLEETNTDGIYIILLFIYK